MSSASSLTLRSADSPATPDHPRWPAVLRQLGASSPIVLWIADSNTAITPEPSRRDWLAAELKLALLR